VVIPARLNVTSLTIFKSVNFFWDCSRKPH
jgi:hypothetical protein